MRLYQGLCTDLLTFALQLQKTLARRPLMKVALPFITSNEVPYLQMRLVGSHSKSEVEGKDKKGLRSRGFTKKIFLYCCNTCMSSSRAFQEPFCPPPSRYLYFTRFFLNTDFKNSSFPHFYLYTFVF